MLFLRSTTGAITQLLTERLEVLGTGRFITEMGGAIYGPVESGRTEPRVATVLVAKADPDNTQEAGRIYVHDWQNSITPVMGTGSTYQGFTLAATPLDFSRTIEVAIADRKQVIAVAGTTGAAMPPGGGDAVWRLDPNLQTDPLRVILHEGGRVPGSRARRARSSASSASTSPRTASSRARWRCRAAARRS